MRRHHFLDALREAASDPWVWLFLSITALALLA